MSRSSPRRSLFTLRSRIAVLTAVAVAIGISITAVATFVTLKSAMYSQFDRELLNQAKAAVGGSLADPNKIAVLPADAFGDTQWALFTSDRQLWLPQGGVQPVTTPAELAVATGDATQSIRSVTLNGHEARMVAVPAGGGTALIMSQSTSSLDNTLRDLWLILLFVGLFGVVAAAIAGYAVARAGLRPVGQLTAAAERVARTEDLTPIEVRSDDELGRLALSFNAMLASLDASRERERRLVADAGHELRTPLTSIRTNLDLLAQEQDSDIAMPSADRAALLHDVRAQIAELGDLVGDLMQLSRGNATVNSDELDLADIVEQSVERVQRRAPSVSFDVHVEPWWVRGDATALERAVTNLLDNAAKWSPTGSKVRVGLTAGVLTVADQGPGIPESERSSIFERFYRTPDARGLPGSGLGLAIVAQAAEQHGGQVAVSAAPEGGALFSLCLPGLADPAGSTPELHET